MKVPSALLLHRKRKTLEIGYPDGSRAELPFEYLRVFSPSAEVRGHGLPEPVLVPGKRSIGIDQVEAVGQYAVRLHFDDGHRTGLYSWDVLEELIANHDAWWARYLARLAEHGLSRDSQITKLSALPPAPRKWEPKP